MSFKILLIIDTIKWFLVFSGVIFTLAGIILMVIAIDEEKIRLFAIVVFLAGPFFIGLGSGVPSAEKLVKLKIMSEIPKVAKAENVEKFFERLDAKTDSLIKALRRD